MAKVSEATLRVLVVDDESGVREVARAMLDASGMEAAVAANGDEALAHIDDGERYDVILIDRTMPDMSGLEVADAIRARCPDQAVVIISGDLEDDRRPADAHLLHKPFGFDALLQAVRAAAAGSPPQA